MAKSIPEVKIGNEVYQIKDRIAREQIELEDDKTNELFGYVNYGYNETAELEINTAYHKYRIGIKRNMTTMLLNGKTTTEPCYVKITNTLDRSATASGITAFTEPIKLIVGHTYKVTSRLLHGSYSSDGGSNNVPPIRVVKHGASANQGSGVRSEDGLEYTRTFTAVVTSGDEALYHIMFTVAASTVVDNALVNVTVEDMTNMSIAAKAISAYNMAGSSLLLPFEYAVDINASEENPVDFNDYTTPGTYRVISMSVMSHIDHSPSTTAGRLIVATIQGASYILQLYIDTPVGGYNIFKRCKPGSEYGWTDWYKILTTEDDVAQAMAEEGDEWSD